MFPNVLNKVPPEETSTSSPPLIFNLTGPEGDNFSFANNKIPTSINVKIKNATTVAIMVPIVLAANIILPYLFVLITISSDSSKSSSASACVFSTAGFLFPSSPVNIPPKLINPIAIKPVKIKVIPNPRKGAGT